jgi:hypothetical protein
MRQRATLSTLSCRLNDILTHQGPKLLKALFILLLGRFSSISLSVLRQGSLQTLSRRHVRALEREREDVLCNEKQPTQLRIDRIAGAWSAEGLTDRTSCRYSLYLTGRVHIMVFVKVLSTFQLHVVVSQMCVKNSYEFGRGTNVQTFMV